MNLLKNYPEIEFFFKHKQFDNVQLEELYKQVENKYQNKKEITAAKSLIKLELLKFDLEKEQPLINKKQSKNSLADEFINLRMLNIKNLSVELDWKSNLILNLLKKHSIDKTELEFLTSSEFNLINEPLYKRFSLLKRQKKLSELSQRPIVKKHDYEKPKGDSGVYGKIAINGGLGKIIYIRKK